MLVNSLSQICNNVMGHLNSKGLYNILEVKYFRLLLQTTVILIMLSSSHRISLFCVH